MPSARWPFAASIRSSRAKSSRGKAKPSAAPSTVTVAVWSVSDTRAGVTFIIGLPTKRATNRLAGCS